MSDIIKFEFDGSPLPVLEILGRKCWVAGQVSTAIGYKNANDVTGKITGVWSDEFEAGIDFDVIKGDELVELKRLFEAIGDSPIGFSASHLTILYESGFYNLCLLSRTPKSTRARKWLSRDVLPSIRKTGGYQLQQAPKKLSEALFLAAKLEEQREEEMNRRLLAEKQIDADRPKVEFAMAVKEADNVIDLGEMARVFCNTGIEIGRNRLIVWMREKKILFGPNNLPYQRYIEAGYFVVKESTYTAKGTSRTGLSTRVTGKGQTWLEMRFRKAHGYNPVEQESGPK